MKTLVTDPISKTVLPSGSLPFPRTVSPQPWTFGGDDADTSATTTPAQYDPSIMLRASGPSAACGSGTGGRGCCARATDMEASVVNTRVAAKGLIGRGFIELARRRIEVGIARNSSEDGWRPDPHYDLPPQE